MRELPEGYPLFRREVVDNRAGSIFGAIMLPQPRFSGVLSWAALLTAILLVAFLFFAEYTHRSTAVGWLAWNPDEARVVAARPGIVQSIAVSVGGTVKEGDRLAVIGTYRSSGEEDNVEERIVAQLRTERSNVQGKMADEERLASSEMERLNGQIGSIEVGLQKLRDLRDIAQERASISVTEYSRTKAVAARGAVSETALASRRDAVLAAKFDVGELDQRITQTTAELNGLLAERATLPIRARKALSELTTQLNSLDQRIAEASGAVKSVVLAPISGRVVAVDAHVGNAVASGERLVVVVPHNATLQAKLLIPSRAAGFVDTGADVLLRIDAFPYEKFGQVEGTIVSVDRAVLTPQEQTGPLRLQEPVYRATVAIKGQSMAAYGDAIPLRAGFTVRAAIAADRRTIMEWLFEPLYSLRAAF